MYNHKTIQSPFSNVCGHYSVYLILFRCHGITLPFVVFVFISNLTENDRRISQFIRDLPKH